MGRHWVSSTHRMRAGGTSACAQRFGAACKVTRNAPVRNQFAVNELLRRRNVSGQAGLPSITGRPPEDRARR